MTDLAAHPPQAAVDSLFAVLRDNAERAPGTTALRFLPPGHTPGERGEVLSRRELDLRARSVAAVLQQEGIADARVLLLLPPGPDFLAGLVGCLYAGAAAVPCSSDIGETTQGVTDEFVAVAADAEVTAVLTTRSLRRRCVPGGDRTSRHPAGGSTSMHWTRTRRDSGFLPGFSKTIWHYCSTRRIDRSTTGGPA